jgi:hypothetical protein
VCSRIEGTDQRVVFHGARPACWVSAGVERRRGRCIRRSALAQKFDLVRKQISRTI